MRMDCGIYRTAVDGTINLRIHKLTVRREAIVSFLMHSAFVLYVLMNFQNEMTWLKFAYSYLVQ